MGWKRGESQDEAGRVKVDRPIATCKRLAGSLGKALNK